MALTSAEQLIQRAQDLGLVDEIQAREIWSELSSGRASMEQCSQLLLRREILTNFQLERLVSGHRSGFAYGDYTVLYLVGTGSFARVYRAAHRDSGKLAAVKVLRHRYSENAEQADRFHREGEMGDKLIHPNIVPIWEVGRDGSSHYIVMEFVEGQNLREFAKIRKRFDPIEAAKLMLDVASGLEYAAQKGLCHRDLKMSNVLVSVQGQAKLVDFGLAGADNTMSDESLMEANPRTIDYAGLERATGVRKDDPRSDIFFVGCMFYHMLTGTAPLAETRDRIQRLQKSRFRDIPPIIKVMPTLPPAAAVVVNKAIQFNPERRYQTPSEMAHDLRRLIGRLESAKQRAVKTNDGERDVGTGEGLDPSGKPRTVMVVESDINIQNVFREQLKKFSYRVLVTSDPQRALHRLREERDVADVAIFGTGMLGEAALEAFNELGNNPRTRDIPAILLLDERHLGWEPGALTAEHRLSAAMPLKMRKLREMLIRLSAIRENAVKQS